MYIVWKLINLLLFISSLQKELDQPSEDICPRPDPSGSMSLSYSHSYSYATTFSKAGKVSKRSRNGKSGKNGGRRILHAEAAASTSSVNAEQGGGLPTLVTTKDANVGVEKGEQNDEGTDASTPS